MKRGYDSDDDYYGGQSSYGSGMRDFNPSESRVRFVNASDHVPKQTSDMREAESVEPKRRLLTDDERNSLAAKILKAELGGKMVRVQESFTFYTHAKERAKLLKAKLELGYAEDDDDEKSKSDHVLLMKMDKKTGLVAPATSSKHKVELCLLNHQAHRLYLQTRDLSISEPHSSLLNSYEKSATLEELVNEEKTTSAKDHLGMFERALKVGFKFIQT